MPNMKKFGSKIVPSTKHYKKKMDLKCPPKVSMPP